MTYVDIRVSDIDAKISELKQKRQRLVGELQEHFNTFCGDVENWQYWDDGRDLASDIESVDFDLERLKKLKDNVKKGGEK